MAPILRILHLEDNSNDAELVKEALAENDLECEITRVDTRKDFQAALKQGGFDLIISDYKLPSFDGISALAIAREQFPELPFIFVSGNIGEERAIETLKNGATDYILKDRLLRLVSSIRRAVREAEMSKERQQLEDKLRQSQKMEAIGKLAGGIAHDFNNLLTVIHGYTEMLIKSAEGQQDFVYRGLEQIRSAAEKSSALTRQLLAFSRRQVLQPKVLDLNNVIAHAYEMLHRLIGEDFELITATAKDLGRVKVDPGQLEQVILNLVVNSRDAMPHGGKIKIETSNVRLDQGFVLRHPEMQSGDYVMLAVQDTGVGMTSEIKSRIFEPFFTTKGEGKGTGLGLATVFSIVKQSFGSIEVDSESGKGTTFRIYLPRVEEEIDLPETKPRPAQTKGSETILLVEDESAVRSLFRKILEMNGYQVLEADGGPAAISICTEYKGAIHLLLTDLVMPEMSGEDLSKKILDLRPEIKILYVSGYTDPRLSRQTVLAPDAAFLQKPFTPQVLAQKVRETLDRCLH